MSLKFIYSWNSCEIHSTQLTRGSFQKVNCYNYVTIELYMLLSVGSFVGSHWRDSSGAIISAATFQMHRLHSAMCITVFTVSFHCTQIIILIACTGVCVWGVGGYDLLQRVLVSISSFMLLYICSSFKYLNFTGFSALDHKYSLVVWGLKFASMASA